MKQLSILFLSFLCALLMTELAIVFLVNFPTVGIIESYSIYPQDKFNGDTIYENIYKPYAKYFDFESGYNIYKKNNFGLIGLDLDPQKKSNVVLIGNSFTENRAVPPERTIAAVLTGELKKTNPDFQVINLGLGGLTPKLGLYRLLFWQKTFKPAYIVILLEGSMLGNTAKFEKFAYAFQEASVKPVTDKKYIYATRMMSISCFANLLRNGLKNLKNNDSPQHQEGKINAVPTDTLTYNFLLDSIKQYEKFFPHRVFVFSVLEENYNQRLSNDLALASIPFSINTHLKNDDKYHLGKNGHGHFNEMGSNAAGKEIAAFLQKNILSEIPAE